VIDNEIYNAKYFQQMVDGREAYFRLADCIHEVIHPRGYVAEVGCGAGQVIERLAELGHDVTGFDVHEAARIMAADDIKEDIHIWGMSYSTMPPLGVPDVDTVICTETGEHLPADEADGLVAFIASMAQHCIIWSAAPPGQLHDTHINLQPPEYWLEKFSALGWVPNMDKTHKLRDRMKETTAQHCGCRDNFYVLERM
jgi:2-polyprenyl-3-methyl-5-hydroxy-6-metoxy-1,4-benzoquinol methylase